MYTGKILFSQVMEFFPLYRFNELVQLYYGDYKVQSFPCLSQFYCMAFAQITGRESLRDIVTCLRANQNKLYHMGIRGNVARSTIADANSTRNWKIYADLAYTLIATAKRLYAKEDFGVEITNAVYAFDSTTIDLCLSLFPWATFRTTKSAIKLHTLLDLRGNIPDHIWITEANIHDVNMLDELITLPNAIYIMDRGYIDFARLYTINLSKAFFVIRPKKHFSYQRRYSRHVDKSTGLRCDQTIITTGIQSSKSYPDPIRRISFFDVETKKRLIFLTNNFQMPALNIAQLYKKRWAVELFFKWIKQHLRIKAFYGTSSNAVKTQIWIAISTYVIIAIMKKQLNLKISLYTILQFLSVSIFEKVPLKQALTNSNYKEQEVSNCKQLQLFDL
ncbi:MAG: IS4 family transposase [Bacteroidota bacterium]|nr:IS4 family transposase [Bacteroidota bacterium]